MKSDQHVHSPYCPHGSNDGFEEYIGRAIELGMEAITFTEHAPLPTGFADPAPEKDSGMDPLLLMDYFGEIETLKRSYKDKITIKAGLEVDYIEGFEKETRELLDRIGKYLDDSILSVHFLHAKEKWYCMDFSDDVFGELSSISGSVDNVYNMYYSAVEKSIDADLGVYKPTRIGHITLAHKFQLNYPSRRNFGDRLHAILHQVRRKGYQLDYNAAGLFKPLCREPYPPDDIAIYAKKLGIPLVYGSDAHQAKDVGQGYKNLLPILQSH
ncbi:histidinol-phosphatase (PHP family) [Bacillus sp. OV322]|uniref:histidinol-phosphatase HisJ n=1 Tax=Bacillus sp. OV322 TaxID=1882764 RepID=UPI0008E75ED1|nr:histidinol-phosphatase HisJ [Bacillus sp. OV322]SFC57967.1 histidinol-phosphatase (PHP family) [Bacillus sp. OV322]